MILEMFEMEKKLIVFKNELNMENIALNLNIIRSLENFS